MKKMNKWHLSASFIQTLKACPWRCYLKYVLGWVPVEDTDALRYGSNWHRILEIANMKPGTVCPECSKRQKNPDCPLCGGTDVLPDDMIDAVIQYLNQAYAICPMNKTKEEWETERIVLLYSLVGYNWYYAELNAEYEVVAQEEGFSIPLRSPTSGRALPNVVIRGRIDKIVKNSNGKYFIKEHKSTSKSLDSDSTYWNHLALDTQTTLYPYAVGQLNMEFDSKNMGVLYDVWHKPTIRPKKLTQADSKKFVETGEYMGEEFEVLCGNQSVENLMEDLDDKKLPDTTSVNGVVAEVEPGAKKGTFTIRETPEMFGARLLKDITERPEFYFVQREIPRTQDDLDRFERELFNIYQTVRLMNKNNSWYQNEQQCEATFKCPYINICYNNVKPEPGNIPEGFKLNEWAKNKDL